MKWSYSMLWAACVYVSAGVASGAEPAIKAPPAVRALFDGRSLAGWAQSGFEGEGEVKVDPEFKDSTGAIIIERGVTLSGITWRRGGELPRVNYEITLEAMRLEGSDFFCGLTFPVAKSACSLIIGGWGGGVVGISSVDQNDASENETATGMEVVDYRWYRIRVRVTDTRIQAWIDDESRVDLEYKDRVISLRPGDIQRSLPLGIATFMTKSAIRNVLLKRL